MATEKRIGQKVHVMSVRLGDDVYRRVRAYATSTGQRESTALRELAAKGLASDGLSFYSTELGDFLRKTMNTCLGTFDEALEQRNAEQEDRIARVVARSAKQASVASLVSVDIAKGIFPGLKDVPVEDVYGEYSRRAGEMAAGASFGEALHHGR
jgi:phosphoribosylpyrophosphate synthetase